LTTLRPSLSSASRVPSPDSLPSVRPLGSHRHKPECRARLFGRALGVPPRAFCEVPAIGNDPSLEARKDVMSYRNRSYNSWVGTGNSCCGWALSQ
jgi:hypothetical protein